MRRLGALLALALAVAFTAAPALAHEGNPNYRSDIRSVSPAVRGLELSVLNFDDRLELVNRTGRTIVVPGYKGEPYARLLADGTVEVNHNSPAYYLNQDRLGESKLQRRASETAPPAWEVLDRTGRFEWHDHRIHWMGKRRPRQIKDDSKRTRVFDWTVPLTVGGQPVRVAGTLFWEPEDSHVPAGAIVALIVAAIGGLGAVLFARRRRREPREAGEAW
jgi:hypothetical protein